MADATESNTTRLFPHVKQRRASHYEKHKTVAAHKHLLKSSQHYGLIFSLWPIWQSSYYRCSRLTYHYRYVPNGKAVDYPDAETLDPRDVPPSHKYFAALPYLYKYTHERIAREVEGVSFYSTVVLQQTYGPAKPCSSTQVWWYGNWFFCNSMQYDMFYLCLQKCFIKKG